MNEEKTKIVKILRSLIISFNPEGGMCLRKLVSEFRDLEGRRLPLFDYRSPLEFLRATGEFYIEDVYGETSVRVKTRAESSHIVKLVSEQNKPRGRYSVNSAQNRLSTLRRANEVVYKNNAQRPDRNVARAQPAHYRNETPTREFSFEQLKSQRQQQVNNSEQQRNAAQTTEFSFEQLKSQRQQQVNNSDQQYKAARTIEFSFEQLKSQQQVNNGDQQRKKERTVEFSFEQLKSQQKVNNSEEQPKKTQTVEFSFEQLRLQPVPGTVSLMDSSGPHLDSKVLFPEEKGSSFDVSNVPCVPSKAPFAEYELCLLPSVLPTEFHSKSSHSCQTEKEEVVKRPDSDIVNETEATRKVATSTTAANQPNLFCHSGDEEVVRFPDSSTTNKVAVTSEAATSTTAVSTNDFVCIEYDLLTKLELPWYDEYWSLLITSCTSTVEIWGKLFGKHCQFDPSSIEVQADLLSNKKAATIFNVGQVYLTVAHDIAYRIRIDNVDHSKNQILCFFVDKGDQKWVDMTEVYNCRSAFIKYPPQAIRFVLYGLEDFPIGNGVARKSLEKFLLHKVITGQIITRKADFVVHNEAAIQVTFFETSGDVFINLQREIAKQMSDDVTLPELPLMELVPVTISHVSDNGDIFCQLQPNSVDYVNKLIKKFVRKVSSNPFLPPEKVLLISSDHMFVVYDQETDNLYRAKLLTQMEGANKMLFIDYGQIKIIPSTKMYYVESSHEEILKFPPQAIRTKLIGIGKVAVRSLVARLRSRFSLKRNAYVKSMQSDAIVPEVKLYFDAEPFMVCVNDSFELECERNQIITTSNRTMNGDKPSSAASDKLSFDDEEFLRTSFASITTPKIGTFPPPKINSCFEIEIMQTESPSNFVIKPIVYMQLWQNQMKSLQTYCKENPATMSLCTLKEGEPYACLKSNGYWYRAFIKFHRSKVYACFCDIADIDDINDVRRIKWLPGEFRTIPKLAMTAKLFGIQPANGSFWQMDDNVQFHRITKGKIFLAEVAKVIYDEKMEENSMLEIRLIYKAECINDLFVESGRAVRL